MKSIHQHGTSFISIPRTVPNAETGTVIDKSKSERLTENEALGARNIPNKDPDSIIKEHKPHPDDIWCGVCGWRPPNRFNKNASRPSGYEGYCKDCRKKIRSTTVWQQTSTE